MSARMRKLQLLLAVVIVFSMILTACAAPATPAPAAKAEPTKAPAAAAPAATKAPEPTKAPAAEAPAAAAAPRPTKAAEPTKAAALLRRAGGFSVPNMEAYANAKREETLMVDVPNRFEGTDNWNPLVPGNATGFGLGQWGRDAAATARATAPARSRTTWPSPSPPTRTRLSWTLKLRPGITWSDGHALNADDIIYSIDIQKATKGLGQYGAYQEWIKEVKKIDDLTVEFILNKANPRFPLERFSDMLCGYDWVVPKHVWEKAGDPLTFKNFDLKQGWPLTTGPYVLYQGHPERGDLGAE